MRTSNSNTGHGLRAIGWLLNNVPLLFLIALFVSPVGPHVRWEYSYVEGFSDRVYTHCVYLGSRGKIVPAHLTPDCPVFVILDSRDWPKP